MKKLIIGGVVVTDKDTIAEDILIEDEKIISLGDLSHLKDSVDEVIDATSCYVLPGLIDPHTHMELKQSEKYTSIDDFFTGTKAAVMGGTTTIIDHIAFGPSGSNLHYSLDRYHEIAKKSCADYSFHGVIQHVDEEILSELKEIIKNEGIASFKAYSTYGYKMSDRDFYEILKAMKEVNGILTVHCENDEMTNYLRDKFASEGKTDPIYHAKSRPNETESESVDTLINMSKMAGIAPLYIVHTSTKEAAARIKEEKENGHKNLFSETCTQYLVLTEDEYTKNGPIEGLKYTMAPPLRKKEDNIYLWEAIKNKTVSTIGTDHCPFYFERDKLPHKDDFRNAPGGAPGVEERGVIIFSEGVMKGKISINRYVEVMSTNAAKIFGMYPRKGALLPGSDADIVIINPNKKQIISAKNHHSNCDYNTYEGFEVNCSIEYTLVRGEVVNRNGKFVGKSGYGKFIPRRRKGDVAE